MKRPFIVTLTGELVLIFTAWNVLRLWTSLAWNATLSEYPLRISPAASAAIGFIWAIAGLIVWWELWQRKAWSFKLLVGLAATYTVWYWCERLLWQNPRPNVPFAVFVNLVLFVFIYFVWKTISREAYERNTENPKVE